MQAANQTDFATEAAQELAAFLTRHARVLVLTGAGVSTASGIPAYRDRDGVRHGLPPLQGPAFRSEAAVRKRYWARSMAGWPLMAAAAPNAAHHAVARLQAGGRIAGLITQNVDGLHARAGSELIELHGCLHRVLCLECGAHHARQAVQEWLERANGRSLLPSGLSRPDGDAALEPEQLERFCIPDCPLCGGVLQPDVVFFGDLVPRPRTEAAERLLLQADAVLAAGSSLMVHSAYRLCRMAAQAGKPVVSLNLGTTRADPLLARKFEAQAEQVLPLLAGLLCPG